MDALGMIETNGLVPAIECADVMLKAARTTLLSQTLTGGGLVTICITGDVGAVQAAVEAGAAAVGDIWAENACFAAYYSKTACRY
jgi:microcompartment protein CcmL/EutN